MKYVVFYQKEATDTMTVLSKVIMTLRRPSYGLLENRVEVLTSSLLSSSCFSKAVRNPAFPVQCAFMSEPWWLLRAWSSWMKTTTYEMKLTLSTRSLNFIGVSVRVQSGNRSHTITLIERI